MKMSLKLKLFMNYLNKNYSFNILYIITKNNNNKEFNN